MILSKFETDNPLMHAQKDLRLAVNMADWAEQPLHVTSAANEVFFGASCESGLVKHSI